MLLTYFKKNVIVTLLIVKEVAYEPRNYSQLREIPWKQGIFSTNNSYLYESVRTSTRYMIQRIIMLRWNEQGEDVNEKLHVLSTYLGHVKPADTFWYLSATPELLKVSCSKYEEQGSVK